MIIRIYPQVTLKASPLSNRGYAVPPDTKGLWGVDPEGVALLGCWGTLSECMHPASALSGGARSARTLGY